MLLAIAEEPDGISLRDLAVRLSVRPPTVTKTMTRLSAQGIVDRRVSTADGRQSFVHLTEKDAAFWRRSGRPARASRNAR